MDLASVLAKFTVAGPIESRTQLDTALTELLGSIVASRDDVPSLLGVLASSTPGLLEAVLASRSHDAFTFRNRVSKALRKSMTASIAILRTCASRLGLFLISLPPAIVLDRTATEDYNAVKTALEPDDSVESEFSGARNLQFKAPTKSSKQDRRSGTTTSINLVPSKRSTSPEPPTGDFAISSTRPKLLIKFIEILTAHDTSLSRNVAPATSTRQSNTSLSSGTAALSPLSESETISQSLHYLPLKQEDIASFLNCTPKLKSGNWPVNVSQRGIKRLREFLPNERDVFIRIEKKIKQLSVGFFPASNQTRLLEKDFGIPIYMAELGDDLKLIYHIDFGAPTSTDKERQFIRIFGVYRKSEVDKDFWVSVAAQLARRGQDYIKRCTDRGETLIRFKGVETTPPMEFAPLAVSQRYKEGADIEIDEAHFLELHRILALEKYVPLSSTFFEAIQKFDEHSFMFQPEPPEHRIIHHPSSCLVLGRSGTGKTTCMLFRMLVLHKSSEKSGRPLRQVFVTQSRMLAHRVEQDWKRLQQDQQKDTNLTHSRNPAPFSLTDLDEDAEEDEVLPAKFSQLEDSHFPLFLTYDRLCKLLEMDYDLQFRPLTDTSLATTLIGRAGKSTRYPLVSFEFFRSNIWPHLDERIKAGLHPQNVYGEFMGGIKGSEASFNSNNRQLDRLTYESQSSRTHAGDQSERSRVYSLFEAYLKKRPPCSYDIADR
ncbi:hypothetical protein FRC00_008573 [Tulasnella sp. 408]|nr:hypothetical protein FRC00_008573 [Tulasnella sp. 408]